MREELERRVALPTRTRYLAMAELSLLNEIAAEVTPLFGDTLFGTERTFNLSDLHPHNIFVVGEKCILIFDYDVRDEWPEVATRSFALHRLCRECVRRNVRSASLLASPDLFSAAEFELIRESAAAFLEGYSAARPDASKLIGTTEGVTWAAAINFAKLVDCLGYALLREPDPMSRAEERLYSEVVKFFSYLKELRVFKQVFDKPLSR